MTTIILGREFRLAMAILSGLVATHLQASNACDQLRETMAVEILEVSADEVAAGEAMWVEGRVNFSDPKMFEHWGPIPLNLQMHRVGKDQGTYAIGDTKWYLTPGEHTFKFHLATAEWMGGDYAITGLTVVRTDKDACFRSYPKLIEQTVAIKKNEAYYDVEGPEITKAALSSKSYQVGDRMEITVHATDKSPICSGDLLEVKAGECHKYAQPSVRIIAWNSERTKGDVIAHLPSDSLEQVSENTYKINVQLTDEVLLGLKKPRTFEASFALVDFRGNRSQRDFKNELEFTLSPKK